jgi:hypothetical protein
MKIRDKKPATGPAEARRRQNHRCKQPNDEVIKAIDRRITMKTTTILAAALVCAVAVTTAQAKSQFDKLANLPFAENRGGHWGIGSDQDK